VDLGEKCKLGQADSYQVCHKWLKDCKGCVLSLDEIRTYCRIVTALSKTIEIQAQIDELYPGVGKGLLLLRIERR